MFKFLEVEDQADMICLRQNVTTAWRNMMILSVSFGTRSGDFDDFHVNLKSVLCIFRFRS